MRAGTGPLKSPGEEGAGKPTIAPAPSAPTPLLPPKPGSSAPPGELRIPTTDKGHPAEFPIRTRGLRAVPESKPGNVLLNLRSFASVKFEHKP